MRCLNLVKSLIYMKCLGRSLYLSCGLRCKEVEDLWICVMNRFESKWNVHSYLWSCHRIQVTEWLRRHWVRLSTVLPILRTSLHFDRMTCYHKCPLLPRSHESSLWTLCTCLVVSTTCWIQSQHPSYDLQWSCVHFHSTEWGTVVGTDCHRYWDWQLIV